MENRIKLFFHSLSILLILLSFLKNSNCQAPKKQGNSNNKKYNSKSIDSINLPHERSTSYYHELPVAIQTGGHNEEACQLNIECGGILFTPKLLLKF